MNRTETDSNKQKAEGTYFLGFREPNGERQLEFDCFGLMSINIAFCSWVVREKSWWIKLGGCG